jgi:hypothetical protein
VEEIVVIQNHIQEVVEAEPWQLVEQENNLDQELVESEEVYQLHLELQDNLLEVIIIFQVEVEVDLLDLVDQEDLVV